MFSKKDQARREEAAAYIESIRPFITPLFAFAPDAVERALQEFFGFSLFLYLARETTDWKRLEPYLSDVLLESMEYFTFSEEERDKRREHIAHYWRAVADAEKSSHEKGYALLDDILQKDLHYKEKYQSDELFAARLRVAINRLIEVLHLENYLSCRFPEESLSVRMPPIEKEAPKPEPAADEEPQKPDSGHRTLTLTARDGTELHTHVLDVIRVKESYFLCLMPEEDTELLILETTLARDGQDASYRPVTDEKLRSLILDVFRTRNPSVDAQ